MTKKSYECVDAGGEFCPCHLADLDECIMCSHLQGENMCDCIWVGECIYQNYLWNNEKSKRARKDTEAIIIYKKKICDDIMFLKLRFDREIVKQLKHPGSYVMLKSQGYPNYYNAPMSIMKVNEKDNSVEILIEVIGPKTKTIEKEDDTLTIRGPYLNGLMGLKKLKACRKKNIVIVGRGMGIAPCINTVNYLREKQNKITFIVDYGKRQMDFMKEYLMEIDCDLHVLNLKNKSDYDKFEKIINNEVDIVYSSGSDNFNRRIYNAIKKYVPNFVISNNAKMCCGEGVCGSCEFIDSDDNTMKLCKAQVNPSTLLN